MRLAHLGSFAFVATLTLAAACTSDAPPSPTSEPTSSATVLPTPSPTPSSTLTTYVPPETLDVLATVWLIDLADDGIITLAEDAEDYPSSATFNLAGFPVLEYWRGGRTQQLFDVDGAPLGAVIARRVCQQLDDDTVRIGGRNYEGIGCGLVSPDQWWMLYSVDSGPLAVTDAYEVPLWDQWLIDLRTDKRTLLHPGMRHCGGCDGRFGPVWSPTGRYVYFAELIQDGSVFLTDTTTLETHLLGSGASATDMKYQPVWAPTSNRLLHPAEDGSSLLEDLETNRTLKLPDIPWPAWFDASGRYIYAPAYEGERLPSSTRETSVFDAATGQLVATREGVPSSGRVYGSGGDPIAATANGFVAALEGVVDCGGTIIYPAGASEGFCIKGGFGAAISPDGSRVALAVRGERVPTHFVPSDSDGMLQLHDIVIVNISTGLTRTVATQAVSGGWPPQIEWDASSTQILVRWPAWFGV